MLSPNNSVAEIDGVAMHGKMESDQNIASFLQENGVSVRFFKGSHILDGFSIIHHDIQYVAVNTAFPLATQWQVARREFSHLVLGHLSDGKCSLFLSKGQKSQAEEMAEALARLLGGDRGGRNES
ncbi:MULTISPECIES: hypothetical protein [Brevibacillus]|uniref:hypothetical protein n=1 Tax=Brevibacillus TaxID=55080 RepID=UPI000D0F531A|nr:MULTISPECIES: hypothetical protein [Brevibacillus]MED1948967.1 hypothetical protein [Brevibacillus formosus]MED2001756.1 hypothetical protein [Brevibacillus formosus]MED2084595.1 hypothetical protein [Brevibacillus formosus]PSK13429.1 hypothetical protein C7R94_23240 [Brevibacillus sp. NRRL NRS-603]